VFVSALLAHAARLILLHLYTCATNSPALHGAARDAARLTAHTTFCFLVPSFITPSPSALKSFTSIPSHESNRKTDCASSLPAPFIAGDDDCIIYSEVQRLRFALQKAEDDERRAAVLVTRELEAEKRRSAALTDELGEAAAAAAAATAATTAAWTKKTTALRADASKWREAAERAEQRLREERSAFGAREASLRARVAELTEEKMEGEDGRRQAAAAAAVEAGAAPRRDGQLREAPPSPPRPSCLVPAAVAGAGAGAGGAPPATTTTEAATGAPGTAVAASPDDNNGGAGTSRGQQRTQPAAEDAGARSRLRRLKLERPLIYPEGDPEAGGCTS
jgi:hypothetical protein